MACTRTTDAVAVTVNAAAWEDMVKRSSDTRSRASGGSLARGDVPVGVVGRHVQLRVCSSPGRARVNSVTGSDGVVPSWIFRIVSHCDAGGAVGVVTSHAT